MRSKIFFTVTLISILFSCKEEIKKVSFKNKVNFDHVDSVWVYKTIKDTYVPKYAVVKLRDNTARTIINDINNADSIGMCKFYANYKIVVYLKNDSIRTFGAVSTTFKDGDDYGYRFPSEDYLNSYFK